MADRALGEPRVGPHPLALFGRAMNIVERRTYQPTKSAGVAYATVGVIGGIAAGVATPSTTAATWLAVGGRSLHESASAIGDALAADRLDQARELLPTLVGRDPDHLDANGIVRAVVESVAENTVDAIVAPALWAAVAGSPGVLAHRAVDTLDSMVGYRNERYDEFGWASARLDDLAAWVPARVTVGLVCALRPSRALTVVRTVARDAPAHPSPNAGVAEAAFAAALGITLGGPTIYAHGVEDRPVLGTGRTVRASDIAAAVTLSQEITLGLAAGLAGYGLARMTTARRRS